MKTKNKKDIAVFVPTRLKSKRLKNKANLLIGKKSAQWCLDYSAKINGIKEVFLLTSKLKQDDNLLSLKYSKKIKIFRGS